MLLPELPQETLTGPLIVQLGVTWLTVAEQELEAVHPFDCVTVTVYTVLFDTEMLAVVAPPGFHE